MINFALCTRVCSNFDSCAILNSQAPKIFCLQNNVDFLGNSEVAFFYTPCISNSISIPRGLKSFMLKIAKLFLRKFREVAFFFIHPVYTGRAYENPTPLGTRKLCSLVISMLMSILQNVGNENNTARK
jgi:hypothetical protein